MFVAGVQDPVFSWAKMNIHRVYFGAGVSHKRPTGGEVLNMGAEQVPPNRDGSGTRHS